MFCVSMCLSYQIDAQSQTKKWVNPLCVKHPTKCFVECIIFAHFLDAPHIALSVDSIEAPTVTISAKRYGREPISLCLLMRFARWRVIAYYTGLAFNHLDVRSLCARHGLFVLALQNNPPFLRLLPHKKPACTRSNCSPALLSFLHLTPELQRIHPLIPI